MDWIVTFGAIYAVLLLGVGLILLVSAALFGSGNE